MTQLLTKSTKLDRMKDTVNRFFLFLIILLTGFSLHCQDKDYVDNDALLAAHDTPNFKQAREDMVRSQLELRGIADGKVLNVMRVVPRHLFVPETVRDMVYGDHPLGIGYGQTISQPYIVALMTELLELTGGEKVLEIGTGSGYQAAILSKLVKEVFTIEIKEPLHLRSAETLEDLEFRNVKTRFGDGYFGWQEEAPFDCIMITAAVNHIPPPLLNQLKDGGRILLPLGHPYDYFGQVLTLVTRNGENYLLRQISAVRFVPMTGKAEEES